MPEDLQRPVIDFLANGRAYRRPGAPVERITTHAADVSLVGRRAYNARTR
jgi:hypothetical protein